MVEPIKLKSWCEQNKTKERSWLDIGITGSRGWKDEEQIFIVLGTLIPHFQLKIHHGGAKGADTIVDDFFRDFIEDWVERWTDKKVIEKVDDANRFYSVKSTFTDCIEIHKYIPNWDVSKSSPFIRNKRIVQESKIMLAFWDGSSPGTKDAMSKSVELNKPLFCYTSTKELSPNWKG